MFCGKCGANIPEESQFCPSCGNPAAQAPAASAAPAAPAAPAEKSAVPIVITFILSLVLLAVSVLAPLITPVYDLPAVKTVMKLTEIGQEDLTDGLYEAYMQLQLATGLDADQQRAAQRLSADMEKLLNNFSVLNFNRTVNTLMDVGEGYLGEEMVVLAGLSTVLSAVIGVIVGSFVLPLLFALLAGLKKSTGLTITAAVFTAISQLIFSGGLWFILSLTVNIIQAVLCSKYRKAK